jgi:UDP-N-acetylglucosamine:LPS N-acetylglucosamine transferase
VRDNLDATALVLSGSIGAGHDTVAEVCAEALASTGIDATVLDCMKLLGGLPKRIGDAVFQGMLKRPPLYDAFHFSGLRAGSWLARSMEKGAALRLIPALEDRVRDGNGLLLSAFATGSGAAARLHHLYPRWRSVAFCTDAAAHHMWVQDGIERYVVCSPGAAGTVRQYDTTADIVELPPPVRAPFFDAPSRSEARRRLGLDEVVPHVLVAGGAWGRGPLAGCAAALADSGYHVLVVGGRNRKLVAQTEALAGERKSGAPGGISIFGFVDDMPTLMAAADVIVTSPGQTCHEARVVDRPMVLLDTVPGHGRENLLIELATGGAIATLPDTERVVRAVDAVLNHDVARPTGWPVRRPEDWHAGFLTAIADLLPEHSKPRAEVDLTPRAVTWTEIS